MDWFIAVITIFHLKKENLDSRLLKKLHTAIEIKFSPWSSRQRRDNHKTEGQHDIPPEKSR